MYHLVEVGSFSYRKPNKVINEDSLLFPTYDLDSNLIFGIADGVGSHEGASEISKCALNAISQTINKNNFSIELAMQNAKIAIDNLATQNKHYSQAATTLTLVQLSQKQIVIGHIGDCRAYVKKNNRLLQLTKDHTRYQELVDAGELSIRKLQQHKERLSSVLTKALTKASKLEFEIITIPIDELIDGEEIFLSLMSDGAYNHWQKRAKFAISTMSSPLAFTNSLRKRIEKNPTDDFSCINLKLLKI